MTDRPLAHTKRGKLLAAAGGLAGGPLGIIVSPLVLILINATKKEGNRFLVWFLLGIPISAGLWFIQIIVISFIGLSTDISESKSNGMKTWGETAEAQQKMNNPDWCHEYWAGPFGDEYKTLNCYQRIHSSKKYNEFRRIECLLDLNPEIYASTVSCKIAPNGYFTDDEVEQNKMRYGSKVSSSK